MFYDPEKTKYFKETLLTVAGQALTSAGYELEQNELNQKRGAIRFFKPLPELGDNARGQITWQLLAFEQSPFARFRIELARVAAGDHTEKQTLSHVIWHIFNADVLPTDDYWWEFRTGDELPHALAHAGKLLFAYGLSWVELREDLPTTD